MADKRRAKRAKTENGALGEAEGAEEEHKEEAEAEEGEEEGVEGTANGDEGEEEGEEEEEEERPALAEWESYADECVEFHLKAGPVSPGEWWKEEFSPEFTHQFFENQVIFGYKGLKIHVFLHVRTFLALVHVHYAKMSQQPRRKRQPDDLDSKFREWFQGGYFKKKDEFYAELAPAEDAFRAMLAEHSHVERDWTPVQGPSSSETSGESGDEAERPDMECQLLKLDLDSKAVRTWHARVQVLLPCFIHGGAPVDQDDPRWLLFIVLERPRGSSSAGSTADAAAAELPLVAGMWTLYRFYRYPDSERLRISQILVLPPFQSRGHGTRILRHVSEYASQRRVYDVTIEDPTEVTQGLREALDTARLLSFPPAVEAVSSALNAVTESSAVLDLPEPGPAGARSEADAPEDAGSGDADVATGPKRGAAKGLANGGHVAGNGRKDVAGKGKGKADGGGAGADDEELTRLVEGRMEPDSGTLKEGAMLRMPRALLEEARQALQLPRGHARRCWEVLLFLRLASGAGGSAGRRAWRHLVWRRLLTEVMGSGREEAAVQGKMLVDLDQWDEGKQMFIMWRKRRRPGELGGGEEGRGGARDGEPEPEGGVPQLPGAGGGDGAVRKAVTDEEEEAQRKESLRILMKEREDEVATVAKSVQRFLNEEQRAGRS